MDKELGAVQSNAQSSIVATVEAESGLVEMGQWEQQHSAKTLTCCWKGNAGLESTHKDCCDLMSSAAGQQHSLKK